jgi:peptidoglycan hydrolase CwlO-like protein
MPEILLSLITSGSVKYIVILLLVSGIAFSLYRMHLNSVELEKQKALNEYNVKQLEQNLKDKEKYIQQLNAINKDKSEIVSNLQIEKDNLEARMKEIETEIDKEKDRPASQLLKNVFKKLGNQK